MSDQKTKPCMVCGELIEAASAVSFEEAVCAVCSSKAAQAAEYRHLQDTLAELMPPLWWRMHNRCILEGFEPAEAMLLLRTYILSQCSSGVNGVGP